MNRTIHTVIPIAVATAMLFAPSAPADEPSAKPVTKSDAGFVCERLRGHSLADFKAKMLETCDVERPFSFSEGDALDKTITYCCHRRR